MRPSAWKVDRNRRVYKLDELKRKISRRRTHDSFGEVFAIDIGVYYTQMRVSTSMDRDLVHDLPTYNNSNAGRTIVSFHSRLP
jgi:hypothetical protein